MCFRMIRAEQLKLRHSPVWLAFIALPLLAAVMGTFNYLQNIEILQDEWYSLWSQHTLFSCYFFLPALIGVYCSYLMRLEHGHHNWNAALTMPVSHSSIYLAKLFSASVMVILTQFWTGILFIISGKLAGIESAVPMELMAWVLCGAMGGIVICALQLCVSMVIRSFAVPVALALVGGIAGLVAVAKDYGVWFPYSLMSLGMMANGSGDTMAISYGRLILHSVIFACLFYLFASFWLRRRDMTSG